MLLGSPEQSDRMLYLQVLSSGNCICAPSDPRSSNLNVRRSDSPGDPVEMLPLTQLSMGVGPAQLLYRTSAPVMPTLLARGPRLGCRVCTLTRWRCGRGFLGQGWSFLVAQRQSFLSGPQTSEDSNVSGLENLQ